MAATKRKTLRLKKAVPRQDVVKDQVPAKKVGLREKRYDAHSVSLSDLGASARAKRDGGIVIEAREVSVRGNVVIVGARAKYECLLDQLLDREIIEPVQYDAGVWLRSLYLRTRQSEGVSRYDDLGLDRDAGRSSYGPEMSDELAWNLRALRDTMLSLGVYWLPVRKLCCDDSMPASRRALAEGLSALAKLRGFS